MLSCPDPPTYIRKSNTSIPDWFPDSPANTEVEYLIPALYPDSPAKFSQLGSLASLVSRFPTSAPTPQVPAPPPSSRSFNPLQHAPDLAPPHHPQSSKVAQPDVTSAHTHTHTHTHLKRAESSRIELPPPPAATRRARQARRPAPSREPPRPHQTLSSGPPPRTPSHTIVRPTP